jgi:predicted dehydrogenase
MKTTSDRQARRVGFVGTGYIAHWHAKALATIPEVELVAVCDKDLGRAQSFAGDYGIANVHSTLESMLDDRESSLEAVHVLLPADLHSETALRILDRGMHVLLEKPMAISVDECESIIGSATHHGVKVGVSHNFLFTQGYEKLRDDLKAGRLGRLDQITITWHRELDQLRSGPFDLWMLRDPQNILLEIGPHCLAPLVDLLGSLRVSSVHASNDLGLPGGQNFYRRWTIVAEGGNAGAVLNLSFASGFTEHIIHIRGSLASATLDLERNTYLLHQHTPYGLDFDRYRMIRREAKSLVIQARRGFTDYVLSKAKLSSRGSPYGLSIAQALRAFYVAPGVTVDHRMSPELGREVVRLCSEIGHLGLSKVAKPQDMVVTRRWSGNASRATDSPEILVLGATGSSSEMQLDSCLSYYVTRSRLSREI